MAKKIICPYCDSTYEGDTCPYCGAPAPQTEKSVKPKWTPASVTSRKKSDGLKWIILVVVVILLLIVVGRFVSNSSDEGSASATVPAETTAADKSAVSKQTEKSSEEASTKESSVATAATKAASVVPDGISLLESDDYIVKITDIYDGTYSDYSWKIYVENKTDKDIIVFLTDVYVDGTLDDPGWMEDVTAGSNCYSDAEWYFLSDHGITEPTIIEGSLQIYDAGNWNVYYDKPFTVTPLGEDNVQTLSRTPQDTDKILLDNEYVTVTETNYSTSSSSIDIDLYIEAKSAAPVMLVIEDCTLNGTMCDPGWACMVDGNKTAYETVTWYRETLEESNLSINDVKDISFSMNVYNTDTFEDYAEESISITAE